MRSSPRLKLFAIATAFVAACAIGAPEAHAQAGVPLYEASVRALKNTQLNYPGSAPFHVKIAVTDSHPDTNRNATIEMWWVSPVRYRRAIGADRVEIDSNGAGTIVIGDVVALATVGAAVAEPQVVVGHAL